MYKERIYIRSLFALLAYYMPSVAVVHKAVPHVSLDARSKTNLWKIRFNYGMGIVCCTRLQKVSCIPPNFSCKAYRSIPTVAGILLSVNSIPPILRPANINPECNFPITHIEHNIIPQFPVRFLIRAACLFGKQPIGDTVQRHFDCSFRAY